MIKLIRPKKPIELTEDKEIALIEKYKKTKQSVWREDYIVKLLLEMSHNKCSYCETILGTQAREMQVDHFHCKKIYPDEVVSWTNLLPSCSQCNSNKSIIDTNQEPIINPCEDNPKDYLYLKHYMIKSKDNTIGSKGRNTVDKLELNHRDRLVNSRIKIADEMCSKLDTIYEKTIALNSRADGKLYNKTKIINTLRDILKMAQPDAEYSAFIATIILTDEDYIEIRDILLKQNLWIEELEKLHITASEIKFDTEK